MFGKSGEVFDCGMVVCIFICVWCCFRCGNGCLYFLFCVVLFKSVENIIIDVFGLEFCKRF